MDSISAWLKKYGITEVECFVPDMAGIARGKIMPAAKYLMEDSIHLPESVYHQILGHQALTLMSHYVRM